MALVDPITLIVVVIVVAFSSIVIILAMRKREEKPKTIKETKAQPDLSGLPFRITKSIPKTEANEAKDELRILDVEREILSDAIRRLYEAHGEGKISESERDRLAGTYKTRMMNIRDSISKDEKVVALHELENMQEDLVKLFSERFGDLNIKVEELRSKIDVEPVKEVKIRTKSLESLEEQEEEIKIDKKRKRRKSTTEIPTPKSEAEKRIEAITSEVEKVLDKLGQIEIDS